MTHGLLILTRPKGNSATPAAGTKDAKVVYPFGAMLDTVLLYVKKKY